MGMMMGQFDQFAEDIADTLRRHAEHHSSGHPGAAPPSDVAQWYILYGRPLVAIKSLRELRFLGENPPFGFMCPMERGDKKAGRGDRKRTVDVPLFGNYFVVAIDLSHGRGCADTLEGRQERRQAESQAGARMEELLALDGVGHFVARDSLGWLRPIIDVIGFLEVFHHLDRRVENNLIEVGDRVRLKGFGDDNDDIPRVGHVTRIIERLDMPARVKILTSMMGREVPVELEASHVERIDRVG